MRTEYRLEMHTLNENFVKLTLVHNYFGSSRYQIIGFLRWDGGEYVLEFNEESVPAASLSTIHASIEEFLNGK